MYNDICVHIKYKFIFSVSRRVLNSMYKVHRQHFDLNMSLFHPQTLVIQAINSFGHTVVADYLNNIL